MAPWPLRAETEHEVTVASASSPLVEINRLIIGDMHPLIEETGARGFKTRRQGRWSAEGVRLVLLRAA